MLDSARTLCYKLRCKASADHCRNTSFHSTDRPGLSTCPHKNLRGVCAIDTRIAEEHDGFFNDLADPWYGGIVIYRRSMTMSPVTLYLEYGKKK